jgi:hypothetical protein
MWWASPQPRLKCYVLECSLLNRRKGRVSIQGGLWTYVPFFGRFIGHTIYEDKGVYSNINIWKTKSIEDHAAIIDILENLLKVIKTQ